MPSTGGTGPSGLSSTAVTASAGRLGAGETAAAGVAAARGWAGLGFDPGRTSYGTGLQGIADRLAALGGTLEVRSVPGSGTALLGMVPVHATETAPG